MDEDVHHIAMQKLYEEQLEESVMLFTERVVFEIYNVNDIQTASWVELPRKCNKA